MNGSGTVGAPAAMPPPFSPGRDTGHAAVAEDTAPAPDEIAQRVVLGLRFLLVGQLPTGEIASFRRSGGGGGGGGAGAGAEGGKAGEAREARESGEGGGELDYVASPLPSALAHDALAPLDPTSPLFVGEAVLSAMLLPPAVRRHALATAAAVRRGLRRFLAWQERPDGRWSYFGRGSGLAPDAATTACATAALLGGPRRRAAAPWGAPGPLRLRLAALARHRSADAPFFTYVDEEGRGWSSLAADGRRRPGFDRVVNAWVLRCLALAGTPDAELAAWVLAEAGGDDLATPDHPHPLRFVHAAARAWADGHLPGGDLLADRLLPHLATWQQADGGFGGPLSSGLALTALLDLEAIGGNATGQAARQTTGQATATGAGMIPAAVRAVVAAAGRDGGWGLEDYLAGGAASRALATAVAVGALARHAAADGERWR